MSSYLTQLHGEAFARASAASVINNEGKLIVVGNNVPRFTGARYDGSGNVFDTQDASSVESGVLVPRVGVKINSRYEQTDLYGAVQIPDFITDSGAYVEFTLVVNSTWPAGTIRYLTDGDFSGTSRGAIYVFGTGAITAYFSTALYVDGVLSSTIPFDGQPHKVRAEYNAGRRFAVVANAWTMASGNAGGSNNACVGCSITDLVMRRADGTDGRHYKGDDPLTYIDSESGQNGTRVGIAPTLIPPLVKGVLRENGTTNLVSSTVIDAVGATLDSSAALSPQGTADAYTFSNILGGVGARARSASIAVSGSSSYALGAWAQGVRGEVISFYGAKTNGSSASTPYVHHTLTGGWDWIDLGVLTTVADNTAAKIYIANDGTDTTADVVSFYWFQCEAGQELTTTLEPNTTRIAEQITKTVDVPLSSDVAGSFKMRPQFNDSDVKAADGRLLSIQGADVSLNRFEQYVDDADGTLYLGKAVAGSVSDASNVESYSRDNLLEIDVYAGGSGFGWRRDGGAYHTDSNGSAWASPLTTYALGSRVDGSLGSNVIIEEFSLESALAETSLIWSTQAGSSVKASIDAAIDSGVFG